MNELMILQHEDFGRIRAEVKNGEPWFVAKDVCTVLGISKHRDAVARLDVDERASITTDTPGGKQQLTAVNESGIYALIFQSRKPEAKKFRKWVTSEVLPSIRRTGGYAINSKPKATRQYIKRGEKTNAEILQLLWLIGEFLLPGDQNAIALELGVSRQTVNRVLNGHQRSNRVLTALYNRAKENRREGLNDFYYNPKQMRERLLGISNGGQDNAQRKLHSGECPEWNRGRGGQPGNQNARKL